MIKVNIYRATNGEIVSFRVNGHAHFSEYGTDIVCASISAVTQGTANAIEKICSISTDVTCQVDNGFLQFTLPNNVQADVMGKIQLLLEAMVVSLTGIELDYAKYVKIIEKK